MSEDNDPYRILGVPRGASRAMVRKQYFALCRQFHPDKSSIEGELGTQTFIKAHEAYISLTGNQRTMTPTEYDAPPPCRQNHTSTSWYSTSSSQHKTKRRSFVWADGEDEWLPKSMVSRCSTIGCPLPQNENPWVSGARCCNKCGPMGEHGPMCTAWQHLVDILGTKYMERPWVEKREGDRYYCNLCPKNNAKIGHFQSFQHVEREHIKAKILFEFAQKRTAESSPSASSTADPSAASSTATAPERSAPRPRDRTKPPPPPKSAFPSCPPGPPPSDNGAPSDVVHPKRRAYLLHAPPQTKAPPMMYYQPPKKAPPRRCPLPSQAPSSPASTHRCPSSDKPRLSQTRSPMPSAQRCPRSEQPRSSASPSSPASAQRCSSSDKPRSSASSSSPASAQRCPSSDEQSPSASPSTPASVQRSSSSSKLHQSASGSSLASSQRCPRSEEQHPSTSSRHKLHPSASASSLTSAQRHPNDDKPSPSASTCMRASAQRHPSRDKQHPSTSLSSLPSASRYPSSDNLRFSATPPPPRRYSSSDKQCPPTSPPLQPLAQRSLNSDKPGPSMALSSPPPAQRSPNSDKPCPSAWTSLPASTQRRPRNNNKPGTSAPPSSSRLAQRWSSSDEPHLSASPSLPALVQWCSRSGKPCPPVTLSSPTSMQKWLSSDKSRPLVSREFSSSSMLRTPCKSQLPQSHPFTGGRSFDDEPRPSLHPSPLKRISVVSNEEHQALPAKSPCPRSPSPPPRFCVSTNALMSQNSPPSPPLPPSTFGDEKNPHVITEPLEIPCPVSEDENDVSLKVLQEVSSTTTSSHAMQSEARADPDLPKKVPPKPPAAGDSRSMADPAASSSANWTDSEWSLWRSRWKERGNYDWSQRDSGQWEQRGKYDWDQRAKWPWERLGNWGEPEAKVQSDPWRQSTTATSSCANLDRSAKEGSSCIGRERTKDKVDTTGIRIDEWVKTRAGDGWATCTTHGQNQWKSCDDSSWTWGENVGATTKNNHNGAQMTKNNVRGKQLHHAVRYNNYYGRGGQQNGANQQQQQPAQQQEQQQSQPQPHHCAQNKHPQRKQYQHQRSEHDSSGYKGQQWPRDQRTHGQDLPRNEGQQWPRDQQTQEQDLPRNEGQQRSWTKPTHGQDSLRGVDQQWPRYQQTRWQNLPLYEGQQPLWARQPHGQDPRRYEGQQPLWTKQTQGIHTDMVISVDRDGFDGCATKQNGAIQQRQQQHQPQQQRQLRHCFQNKQQQRKQNQHQRSGHDSSGYKGQQCPRNQQTQGIHIDTAISVDRDGLKGCATKQNDANASRPQQQQKQRQQQPQGPQLNRWYHRWPQQRHLVEQYASGSKDQPCPQDQQTQKNIGGSSIPLQ